MRTGVFGFDRQRGSGCWPWRLVARRWLVVLVAAAVLPATASASTWWPTVLKAAGTRVCYSSAHHFRPCAALQAIPGSHYSIVWQESQAVYATLLVARRAPLAVRQQF